MSTLETAAELIAGERREAYGEPDAHFAAVAVIWSVLLRHDVPARMVPLMMAALKMARLSHDLDSEDGWVDLAGYAGLGGDYDDHD